MKTHVVILKWFRSLPVLGVGLWVAVTPTKAQFIGTTGFDYTTGKYGEADATKILYVPFTGEYDVNGWMLKFTVPYIQVSGPGNVVRDVGVVGRPQRASTTTESGLGDMVASAGYDFYYDQVSGLTLTATGKVKFGTASRSRGLGTGENDVMFQVDISEPFGPWMPFGTLGYRFLGSPPGIDLRNGFYGSVGAGYYFDTQTSAGVALDLRGKTTANGDAAAELSAFVTHRLDRQLRVQGYVISGLTNASPDFGIGGTVSYSF